MNEFPALEVEPVKGLDEPQACNLEQVIQLLRSAPVAQRQRSRQRQEAPDELLPEPRIVRLRVLAKQVVFVG